MVGKFSFAILNWYLHERSLWTVSSVFSSGADPGCLSRILIFVHPGSWDPGLGPRIPDPKIATKERGKKILLSIFCSHENHKIENYINFELVKKKIYKEI